MPFGRYPERVKDFTKWSRTQVEKSKLSGSATGASRPRPQFRRKRRRKKKEE